MNFDTPQMYRWRDPNWPPHIPSLSVHFIQTSEVNAEVTAETGVQSYDNVLVAVVAPMGMPKSDMHHELERTLPDGTVRVNQSQAMRFADQLRLFKAGTSSEASGTPLKELIGMTPAAVMNLKARGIHNVEMLAEMPDGAGTDLMGFWDWRDKARKHVEHREKNAPILRMEAIEAKHAAEKADMQRQIDEMRAILDEKTKPRKAA